MTGELCDCFETKRAGVHAILDNVAALAGATPIRVWCTKGRFLDMDTARTDPYAVAAANWLALAHLVAQRFADECVLLIDTGSTTTDIVYLNHGVPEPRGFTDPERLASGELVYTGVRRTPISAVLGSEVAAEFFATMLDAYVLTSRLAEDADDCDTADGRPRTRRWAHARLARMLCADVETFSESQANTLARQALAAQQSAVVRAIESVLQRRADVQRIVVAGSGAIVGLEAAKRLNKPMTSLAESLGAALSEAACAYAVAMLAAQEPFDAR
jgi:probable H4MPT-linked C1 transfer pathway protein